MFHSKYAENRLFFVATCEISRVVIECRSFDRELADPSSATRSRITARAWVLGRQETATPGVFCQTTTTREHHDAPLRPVWIVARNQCRRRAMLLAMIKAVKPFIATDANPDTRRSDDRSVWPHPELHYHIGLIPGRKVSVHLPTEIFSKCQDGPKFQGAETSFPHGHSAVNAFLGDWPDRLL